MSQPAKLRRPPVLDDGSYRAAIARGRPDHRLLFDRFEGDETIWADGSREPFDAAILATGYRPHLPYLAGTGALDGDGRPIHRGASRAMPSMCCGGCDSRERIRARCPVPERQRNMDCRITYIGTATFLLEIGGLRLLTDPVLDPAGSRETLRVRPLGLLGLDFPLVKLAGPALPADELPDLDAVLLSHDEHYDNLDAEGRALLHRVPLTLTTESGAKRLGGTAAGLGPWQSLEVTGGDGVTVRVTGVPALHGPRLLKRYLGDVTGFVLEWEGQRHGALYISGDTVLFGDLAEIGRRFEIGTAIVHIGCGGFDDVTGPLRLSLSASQGVRLAELVGARMLVPAHYDGWAHFTEPRRSAEQALGEGFDGQVVWLKAGEPTPLEV